MAADRTLGPIVTSISGTTTGVVGDSYTFSGNVTSDFEYPISYISLRQTTNAEASSGSSSISSNSLERSPETCTGIECSVTGNFTPSSTDTYYIYINVNFSIEGGLTSCNSHPSESEGNCLDSRGKYITFIVVDEDEENEEKEDNVEEKILPETSTVPRNTYLLTSTGLLLLFSSSQVKNLKFSNSQTRKRDKFEKRFK